VDRVPQVGEWVIYEGCLVMVAQIVAHTVSGESTWIYYNNRDARGVACYTLALISRLEESNALDNLVRML
jgi:hypothetical protein